MAAADRRRAPVSAGGVVPDEFLCPISGDVMRDPVWLDTGITVDRDFAAYYMQAGYRICPVTGEPIRSRRLISVRAGVIRVPSQHMSRRCRAAR